MALRESIDYQLKQSIAPGRYFMDRINYARDACPLYTTVPGISCEAIYPPRNSEQIDKESVMRGITNRAGQVLRDSIVPNSALLRNTGPFVLPQNASAGVPAPEAKFRGSLRGETTSVDVSRIGPQWIVDGHNIQNPMCIMEEDNKFSRAGLWTRNIYKDRASVKTCLH